MCFSMAPLSPYLPIPLSLSPPLITLRSWPWLLNCDCLSVRVSTTDCTAVHSPLAMLVTRNFDPASGSSAFLLNPLVAKTLVEFGVEVSLILRANQSSARVMLVVADLLAITRPWWTLWTNDFTCVANILFHFFKERLCVTLSWGWLGGERFLLDSSKWEHDSSSSGYAQSSLTSVLSKPWRKKIN